jgi:NAD(P)-dependent dehydrogenase (short-subunit alcohol dehydrogenase family)
LLVAKTDLCFQVAEEVSRVGSCEGFPVQLDVTDADSVVRMVDSVIAKFGRIDVLVCNAGALW